MTVSSTKPQPAILGGSPAVTLDQTDANRWPIITDEDIAAVTEVLRGGELSINLIAQALEQDYRAFFGVKHALACCNGTSAIFAALHSFGLEPGDEVIVPTATYWASVMPLLWCGAVPVFCESEFDRLGLDPVDVEAKITPRTRAMVIVHLWGMPSKMDQLLAICAKHKLKVFEDASHAHGAKLSGQLAGTFGDAAVFSLQTQKLAPAGEGGMLLTNDDAIHEHALCLGHFERILGLESPARRFAGTGFGLKHRMAPLSAALARTQFKHLTKRNKQRNDNIEYLSRRLEPLGIKTFLAPPDVERVYFQWLVENRESETGLPTDTLVAALKAEGCHVAAPRYPLLHQQPVFTEGRFIELARLQSVPRAELPVYRPDALPRTVEANQRMIQMPSFPSASRELLDQYAMAFEKVIGSNSEIGTSVPGSSPTS